MKSVRTGILALVAEFALRASLLFVPPNQLQPYLPVAVPGQDAAVEGEVVRKQREADRLLLTITTPQGALLASFHKRVTEIDLLVEEGDSITLALRTYEPFVTDPSIKAVVKPDEDDGVFTPDLLPESGDLEPPPVSPESGDAQGARSFERERI